MAVSTHLHQMPANLRGPQKGAPAARVSPHPASAKPAAAAHPAPHPAAHPAAHPVAHHPVAAKPEKKSHTLLYSLLALAILGAGAGIWAAKHRGPAGPTPEALVTQIQDSAISAAPPANVYGGMIFSDKGNPPSITVAGIPNQACVSAGWRLARTGIVTINGAMPERISAALLSELCNQNDANALSWTPKDK